MHAPPLALCLIGPHGAGKTTLGRALSAALDVPFRDEIGRLLREAALARDPEAHALRVDEAFDRAVVEGELARDVERVAERRFVVETWHPGNFAYARRRSPAVAARFAEAARQRARTTPGLVIVPVTASVDALMGRCSEPGGTLEERTRFFVSVARDATEIARAWGLRVLESVDTSSAGVEACVARLVDALEASRPARRRHPRGRIWSAA